MAIKQHKNYHDKKMPVAPVLVPGDKVWLSSAKNTKTVGPAKKLDHKKLGPFTILKIVGRRSFKLQVPHSMEIYPVVHAHLLEKVTRDRIRKRTPAPVVAQHHEEFEVEAILDSKTVRKQRKYLVHWKGYTTKDRTWEPVSNLTHCLPLLRAYHRKYPLSSQPARAARLNKRRLP